MNLQNRVNTDARQTSNFSSSPVITMKRHDRTHSSSQSKSDRNLWLRQWKEDNIWGENKSSSSRRFPEKIKHREGLNDRIHCAFTECLNRRKMVNNELKMNAQGKCALSQIRGESVGIKWVLTGTSLYMWLTATQDTYHTQNEVGKGDPYD